MTFGIKGVSVDVLRDLWDIEHGISAETWNGMCDEIESLRKQCETAIAATEKEIIRTGFTLTPEQGLGAIYNAMLLALGRTPWGGRP